jgi:hypothetical protein
MNTDVADLLHESIDRLTDGARVPDGLADRALHRNRQRQLTLSTAIAGGTAVLATAAMFAATAITGGAPRSGGTLPAQTAAYVVSRTERALAAAERGRLLQEIHVVGRGSQFALMPQVPPMDVAPQAVIWSYHGRFRAEGLTADGRPVFDAIAEQAGQRLTARVTGVEYPARIWWTETAHQFQVPQWGRPGCGLLPPPMGVQINWPASIHKALSCSAFRIAGRQWIDGIHTIKIVSARRPGQPAPPVSQVFWVDPATYLPVRARWGWPAGHGRPTTILSGDFRWLTPTAAHLAALHVSVPSGFRHVPASRVVNGDRLPLIEFTMTFPGQRKVAAARAK